MFLGMSSTDYIFGDGDEDWCATDIGRVNVNVNVKLCVDQGVRSCNNMIGFERGFILFIYFV